MLRGLYTSATGLNAEILEQDVVANNIANVNTVAFKKDTAVLEAFPNRLLERIHDRMDRSQQPFPPELPADLDPNRCDPPLGWMGQGVAPEETVTEFSPGPLTRTDQPLDLAIEGNGLFTVQKGDGGVVYTRAGNFSVNSAKELCTLDGDTVLGHDHQPIVINGLRVVVDTGGAVKVDGRLVGTLQMVEYDPARYAKIGDNLWARHEDPIEAVVNEGTPPGTRVLQGYIEQSNVQIVSEMVRMISLMRAYEENTKAITMQDETLSQLISSVGTPSA